MAGFTQFERGVDPRDLADGDDEGERPPECRNEGCSGVQRDGFAGCCSTACAVEVGRSDDREPERDDRPAAQEGEA